MRLPARFSASPLPYAPEIRWIERTDELVEAAAPPHWTTTRVEAWLDWADGLPADLPPGAPAALALEGADGLLAGGPDRYARRLAAWGLALGVFADVPEAAIFRAELFAALALGVIATGRQLPFGARVNPLAPDPARPPPLTFPELGRAGFAEAARALQAGRGLAAGLAPGACPAAGERRPGGDPLRGRPRGLRQPGEQPGAGPRRLGRARGRPRRRRHRGRHRARPRRLRGVRSRRSPVDRR